MTEEQIETIRKQIVANGVAAPDFFDPEGLEGYDLGGKYMLQQNSHEFARFIGWAKDTFPSGMDTYLEIGSASGSFMRSIYEFVKFECGISVDDGQWLAGHQDRNFAAIPTPVIKIRGNSHLASTGYTLGRMVGECNYPDLIFIDGDHTFEGVCEDIDLSLTIANSSAHKPYLAFHDVEYAECGVGQAIQKYLDSGALTELHRWVHPLPDCKRLGISVCEIGK